MGCSGSKVENLPIVTLCRERKEFIKIAAEQRYVLAAYHMLYFRSLKDVGEALRKFVDEELVIGVNGGGESVPDSPVLTLPTDEGKKKKKRSNGNSSSDPTSLTHSASSPSRGEDSHLHFGSSSDDDDSSDSFSEGHIHLHSPDVSTRHSPDREKTEQESQYYGSYPPYQESNSYPGYQETGAGSYPAYQETGTYGSFPSYPQNGSSYPSYQQNDQQYSSYQQQQQQQQSGYSPNRGNYNAYYMKKSTTAIPSVIYEDPQTSTAQWGGGDSSYANYPQYSGYYGNAGYDPYNQPQPQTPVVERSPPPPPPPPEVSSWGFLNPFEAMENNYSSFYGGGGRYGVGSMPSSPDSVEVRQREGIPDLEDDTEQEPLNDIRKQKPRGKVDISSSGEGTSKSVPPPPKKHKMKPVEENEITSSSSIESIVSTSTGEEAPTKKSVSFEADGQTTVHDEYSSKSSSGTTLSVHGTRDIQEVVKEIRDEFEVASDYGKEVAVMLEVGKMPYQPRSASLKVILSKIHNLVAPPTVTSSHSLSRQSQHAVKSVKKMANIRYEDFGDFEMKSGNLSATLERLYTWERKLYKEVKGEERLRVIYEKKFKKLNSLGTTGADPDKIEATHVATRKLLTKIDVALRTVDAIAKEIHKLREEELQPQITELINGLIRMWKFMFKCHTKQFQAIKDSKNRILMANVGSQTSSSLRATVELELELRNWCTHFTNWINTQKAYVESLNSWLSRCLLKEPEVTDDGIVPFSPSRAGAPPIFVICNDWFHAMERLSESEVESKMNAFASNLHQLWERQDEEQRQRLNAEYLKKDFEKRLLTLRKEQVKREHDKDAISEKSAVSVTNESGISPLDDLKVDLDSMRQRLQEEKAKHKATIKQVHEAASNSLQAGLVPIFDALGNFVADTLKEYDHIRVGNAETTTEVS
ncbi:hypothetical protein ACHQM5_022836 [Ranunculus cassubicifolius]